MRFVSTTVVVLLVAVGFAHSQSAPPPSPEVPDRSYKLLREDENWSFLANPAMREDFWDPIKFIPLRRGSDTCYLTFSGQVRFVWEKEGNLNCGHRSQCNNFFLQRDMLGLNEH